MHEFIIAQQVVRAVLVEARARGASEVRAVALDVGVLEGLDEENLRRAFEIEAEGTIVHKARLVVSLHPALALCRACETTIEVRGTERHAGAVPRLDCPRCGTPMRVEGGRGYVVRSADLLLAPA